MAQQPPHITAQLGPTIDDKSDAPGSLRTTLGDISAAAKADVGPDAADNAFVATAAVAARMSFGSESGTYRGGL